MGKENSNTAKLVFCSVQLCRLYAQRNQLQSLFTQSVMEQSDQSLHQAECLNIHFQAVQSGKDVLRNNGGHHLEDVQAYSEALKETDEMIRSLLEEVQGSDKVMCRYLEQLKEIEPFVLECQAVVESNAQLIAGKK